MKLATKRLFAILSVLGFLAISFGLLAHFVHVRLEARRRLERCAPIGGMKQAVIDCIGGKVEVLSTKTAPKDYYYKGNQYEVRPIAHEVMIFSGPYVDTPASKGFRGFIIYVYLDKHERVEHIFVGGT